MKIRSGFVSNSSSSSFMIKRSDLTKQQLHNIVDHIELSEEIKKDDGEYAKKQWGSAGDDWGVHIAWNKVICDTSMDNFDMRLFLKKIGVDLNKVKFDDQYSENNIEYKKDEDYDEEGGEKGWAKK